MNATVDVKAVNELFDRLGFSNAQARRTVRNVLRKASRVIRDEARTNLQKTVNGKGGLLDSKNLVEFVRNVVYKDASGASVKATQDKTRKTSRRMAKEGKTNKSFLLPIIEGGTGPRYTKSWKKLRWFNGKHITRIGRKGYRGVIRGSGFFARAVSLRQAEANRVMSEGILERLRRAERRMER